MAKTKKKNPNNFSGDVDHTGPDRPWCTCIDDKA